MIATLASAELYAPMKRLSDPDERLNVVELMFPEMFTKRSSSGIDKRGINGKLYRMLHFNGNNRHGF